MESKICDYKMEGFKTELWEIFHKEHNYPGVMVLLSSNTDVFVVSIRRS